MTLLSFLVSKDKTGRTLVHSPSCSGRSCRCPTRLAAGSVDSVIGKLRSIFNDLGRSHDSNPVSHPRVKSYLKFVREEQASRGITPSQAVPLFFEKFVKLVSFLAASIRDGAHLSISDKYILVRDAVFFVVDFFTGNRASDLGRLLSSQVFRLKDRQGFLFKLTLTKNARGDAPRTMILEPFHDQRVCPVLWVEYYLTACHQLGVVLSQGYFFRATDKRGKISERPFLGSAVNSRLRKYLLEAEIHGGETPHSFRVGLSNTLNMLGCSHEEISRYLGWRSSTMVSHYTRSSNASSSALVTDRASPTTLSLSQTPASHPDNLETVV